MSIDDFYFLGKITRTSGHTGELFVFLDVDDPEKYHNLESFFIEINKQYVPFFIEKINLKPNSNKAVVRLQDIDSMEKAASLVNASLYLPMEQLPPLKGKSFYFHEVIGFKVIDAAHGDIGEVRQIFDLPQQALLQVMLGKKEILIPLNDEIITSVDRKNKILKIDAPEGLIEIYL